MDFWRRHGDFAERSSSAPFVFGSALFKRDNALLPVSYHKKEMADGTACLCVGGICALCGGYDGIHYGSVHGECLSGECVERYGGKACLFETGGGIKRAFDCEGDGRNSPLRMYLWGSIAFISFCLTLSLVILAGNLLPGKGKGLLAGMLFCLYGFLLDPRVLRVLLGYEEYEMYKVNVLIGWISP